VNNFYQATSSAIPATDPSALNVALSSPAVHGYSGAGRIDFTRIGAITGNAIHYVPTGGGDIGGINTEQVLTQNLTDDLLAGRPVVIHLKHNWPSGHVTDHYITATGICGGQYIVSDSAGVLNLYDPGVPGIYPFVGIRRFSP
jgi:hypothetical protein